MHVNRGLLNWGVFFILLGGIPIAVQQGLIPEAAVEGAWRLWPLLLITAGLGLLLRRTPLGGLGGLMTAVIFGIIGGGLLATGGIPFASCGDEAGSVAFPAQRGELGPTASVDVALSCGELTIRAVDGSAWTAEGVGEDGAPPEIAASPTSVEIRSGDRGRFTFGGSRDRWTISLPTASTIDLDATVNAGSARLALDGARLGRLAVTVNAGEATIDIGGVTAITAIEVQFNAVGNPLIVLPNLPLRGSIEGNAAGNVRICPPAGAGLRLTTGDNITASNNFAERGLVEAGEDTWETRGFASAAVRIELDAEVNAGTVNLEQAGTCNA